MGKLVKILLNGKPTLVYPGEASILIAKGLAQELGEKAIKPDYGNKMEQPAPKNKSIKKGKNATGKNNN